jgi:2-polyprenyl-6-methoxyphenol hydroxylase-like FAD-dependent oxidoreductase
MKTRQNSNVNGRKHAIVIGGSMAGLLAARVLSDYFERVTIFERDVYPEGTDPRRGLPQGHHLHALLGRGQEIIEEFFPGIREELIANGACVLDSGDEIIWRTPQGWGKPFHSGLKVLAFSRPFLDWHVRRRLSLIENVEIVTGSEVTGLVTNSDRDGVSGISFKLHSRDGDEQEDAAEFIAADLVVDASGRNSRAPQWLTALGYEPPRESIVNAFLGYASRTYARPNEDGEGPKAIFLQAAPPDLTRMGIVFPIEGNRWMLTLCGGDRDYPPVDDQEFLDFARSLPNSLIFDIVRDAKSLSPIRSFRATQNRCRHYEAMRRFPGQFILLGDSVCAFNPVYGQGMTIAAMGALELNRTISQWKDLKFGDGFTRRFQKRLAKINSLPWALATNEDCRYRGTEGASRTLKARLMHAYLDRVIAITTKDIKVRALWLKVFQMLKPPSVLFSPSVLLKVLREIIAQPRPEKHLYTFTGARVAVPRQIESRADF